LYSFSLRSCKFWTNYICYFFDLAKNINNGVRFASIFPNSEISGFVSLRYLKYSYYRSIASLRFDIVAIARNEYTGERVGDIQTLCGQKQAPEGNSSQANRQDKPGTALKGTQA
jgi:hypothetical protein